VAFSDDVAYLLKRAIPDALDPIVRRAVGAVIPRTGDDHRYRIAYTGSFSSRVAADLLAFGRNQRLDGALVVVDADVLRAIYYREGRVVGADSNVIFERLGRVLLRAGVVDEAIAADLVAREEANGVAAAAAAVPADAAKFGLERRAWDISAALFLVPKGHFVIVEGAPDLGDMEPLDLAPTDLALEGLRRYDEWRRGSAGVPIPERRAPETRPPTPPPPRPDAAAPPPPSPKADPVEDFLKQIRSDEG
jgi:hypothetical protein